jgi:hypothetical protein
MARRSLSTQGRVLAAGLSVAVGGVLAGFMAARDHSASASPTGSSSSGSVSANSGDRGSTGSTATPYDDGGRDDFPTGSSDFPSQAQPQTRTGGS